MKAGQLMEPEENPDGNDGQSRDSAVWSILLGFFGFLVGLVAGFILFVLTYPFEGSGRTPVWQVSTFDGVVIVIVGGLAYAFRKRSYFLRGIVISAAMLFIVNGLCGVNGR
jgi:Na+/H+-translocating membrane pyrophosphatase